MLKKMFFLLSFLLMSSIGLSDTGTALNPTPITLPPVVQKPVPINKHQTKVLDKIIAIVNDDVIMQSQLDQKLNLIQKQMAHSATPLPSLSVLRKQVLDNIIDVNLQLQIAKKTGLTVENKEVTDIITDIAKKNNMTPALFQEALAHDGINYAAFQEQIHDQILVNKVVQQIVSKNITISAQEILNYQKTHKVTKKVAQEVIYQQKMQEAFKKWIQDLHSSAYIKIMN